MCQRLLCRRHDQRTDLVRARRGRRRRPTAPTDDTVAPADPARADGGTGRIPRLTRQRHYCHLCVPAVHPRDGVLLTASAEIALGALVGLVALWLGVVLVVVGALRVVLRLALRGSRRTRAPLLLDPRVTRLELV